MLFWSTYVQASQTAYADPESTLWDNFWPRYDQKHDSPYMEIFESLAFLTKSKILMQKSHALAVNHKRGNAKGDKTAYVGQKHRL